MCGGCSSLLTAAAAMDLVIAAEPTAPLWGARDRAAGAGEISRLGLRSGYPPYGAHRRSPGQYLIRTEFQRFASCYSHIFFCYQYCLHKAADQPRAVESWNYPACNGELSFLESCANLNHRLPIVCSKLCARFIVDVAAESWNESFRTTLHAKVRCHF